MYSIQLNQTSRNFGLSQDSFQELIARLRAGDQALFEHVFLHHFGACMNFLIYRKNVAPSVAYDATMDTLIAFRQMLVDGKAEYGNLRFLFTRMAVFAAQKMQVKNSRIDPLETLQHLKVAEPEEVDEASVQLLGLAWGKLNEACRRLLRGYYYDNQSWKDIAFALGMSEENARKKGQRCRKALYDFIKPLLT